jgi:ferredoxin-NADP reductase
MTPLIERTEVAEGTIAFALERPPGFEFKAGQFVIMVLPNPPHTDAEGNRRVFSIASPPQDTRRLVITTRMTGTAFKRSLAEVPLGTPVDLSGPAGTFELHPDASLPVVFIAGGIGITPFRSILHDAASRHLPHRITLIYSNRTPAGTAFHDEFVRLAQTHSNLHYIPTMTQADKSGQPWDGERRPVTADFLRGRITDIPTAIFYLAGPPGLVAGVNKTLSDAGADPARIYCEEFAGY